MDEKVASYISSLLGRDAGRARNLATKLERTIKGKSFDVRNATKEVQTGFGPWKKTQEVRAFKNPTGFFANRAGNKATSGLRSKLRKVNRMADTAQKTTNRVRLGTGVAAVGGGYALNQVNKKNPYIETGYTPQQPMYTYASEKTAGFKDMWDKAKTIRPRHVLDEIKSIATGSGYRNAKQKLLDVNAEVAPSVMDDAVRATRAKKDQIANLEKKISEQKGFVTGAEGSTIDESIDKALKQEMNTKTRAEARKLKDYKDIIKNNEDLLGKQKGEVEGQISEFQRKKDNELGKRIFGIGGVGAGVALGGKAIYDRIKEKQKGGPVNVRV